MTKARKIPEIGDPIVEWIRSMKPPRVRSYREFAEQEIILPDGPRKGMRFSCDFAPWTGLLLDEFSRGDYRRYMCSGSVQSGKTLVA